MTEISTNDQQDLIEELVSVVDLLGSNNKPFAESLTKQWEQKHHLSEKQWYWVEKLIRDAITPPQPPKPAQLHSFEKVYALIQGAKESGLKYPKLRLAIGERPVVFSLSGQNAKYPNVVNVTDGGPFGENQWYGRIDAEGHWTKPKSIDDSDVELFTALFNALADDPKGTLEHYGKVTGNCACCGSGLTDPKSVAIGIGPVCAKKWGVA